VRSVLRSMSLRLTANQPAPAAGLMLIPFDVVLVPESKIARVDRCVDQNIRQLMPVVLTLGFSYLVNGAIIH